jgi:hypothetical protein
VVETLIHELIFDDVRASVSHLRAGSNHAQGR